MFRLIKKYIEKTVSLLILLCFVITFVFQDFAFAGNERKFDDFEKNIENSILIDSNFYNRDTLIIHILDTHSDPEVQKKISGIISFYDKRKPVEKIFAEGAPLGKVSLDLFKNIDKSLKKEILNKMLANAQIGACEYYASYNDRDMLFGIEDNELYNINLKLIQDMLVLYEENELFFKSISAKVEMLKKIHLSRSLFDLEKAIEEKIPDSYSKIKSFLKKDKNFDESEYEEFFTHLSVKEQSLKANYKSAIKQVSSLNKYLSSVMSYGEYMKVSGLMTNSDDKLAIAQAYSIISAKVPEAEKRFPVIMNLFKLNYISSNINIYDVYMQKQKFKKYIVGNYGSEEEKEIMYLSDMVEAVKEIYALEITRNDLLNFINARKDVKSISRKYIDIAESNTLVYLADNKITDQVYINNLQRDAVFFDIVKNSIGPQAAVTDARQDAEISGPEDFSRVFVVVTGGFHLEFTDFLKENKISYVNIAPKLEKKTDRKQYLDAINLPGKLGSKNITFERSAFAPPLLNAVNSNENEVLKGIIIKNIIQAWVSSAQEAGLDKEIVYADMLQWLRENNVSKEKIKNIKELSFLADMAETEHFAGQDSEKSEKVSRQERKEKTVEISAGSKENTMTDAVKPQDSAEEELSVSDDTKEVSLFERIKNKLGANFQHWSFPTVSAAYSVFKAAKSYQDLVNIIKNLKKVNTIEFEVKQRERDFYIECRDGFTISVNEALDIVEKFARKKSKTEIILKLDQEITGNAGSILGLTLKRKNKFVIISGDKEFVKSVDTTIYKNVNMAYKMPSGLGAVETLAEIKSLTADGVFGLNVDKEIFDSVGAYLFSKYDSKYLNLYIQDGKVEEQYSDFIFEGRGKTLLISSEPMNHLEQKKRSLAAYRNVSATPLIQLVIGFEFFASFSMIFLSGKGYDLSFLSAMFAICGPLNIIGSLASSYLSRFFGKRNVLITNLFLHCAGDALLLFAGTSPVFLGLALGVPAMAAAGIATLLIPFLHSSLKTIGKEHKFESVYGKTRSIFWIGLALSSILGSWLAQAVGQTFVIALSSAIITVLSVYALMTTGSLEKSADEAKTDEEKEFSNLKEGKKIWEAIKTVFTKKGLNTTVIINFIVDSGLFVLLALGIQPMLVESGLSMSLLGIVAFSVNIVQSIASKFVNKVSSFINNAFKRTIYFASLTALVSGFIVFNNPALLIVFYILANFWQGASSVIEPTKVEETLSDDISPYWFSAKTIINSGLAAGAQLILASALNVFNVDIILMAVTGIITVISAVLGFFFKNKREKTDVLDEAVPKIQYTKHLLSAA